MLKIHSVKADEDIELVKGLLEEYITSWFEFDGFDYEKEADKELKHGLIRNDLKTAFINRLAV